MNPQLRQLLRNLVLTCRQDLESAVARYLEGRLTIFERNHQLIADRNASTVHLNDREKQLRDDLLTYLAGDVHKYRYLVRETAFTWLNRLVAFKMLENRGLIRETINRWEDSNGFKRWVGEHDEILADYERGGEFRTQAYRQFLLQQCEKLAQEIRVLFDTDNLPSRLVIPMNELRGIVQKLNAEDLKEAWQYEETLGWVYQFFVENQKQSVFDDLNIRKIKISAENIPPATQIFTPNWMVKFLVHNSLGRLWIEMHPDSQLAQSLDYLVPFDNYQPIPLNSVREIRLLDPACGTMHFGLVAFDLFVQMYQEEIAHAGSEGWLQEPPVQNESEIPASILAHNLHGIDIDLRAVQIAALALYIKAKTVNKNTSITTSRLACAHVQMANGEYLREFLERSRLSDQPIYERIFQALQTELKKSAQLGSLLPLEQSINRIIQQERKELEADLFRWQELPQEASARQHFWEQLEQSITEALGTFTYSQTQLFFARETVKGLKLLELLDQTYDVVVANPPYLTARNMNPSLKELVAEIYPEGKSDLYACFLMRCTQLLHQHGRLGMVTQQSFMFISSYERLRAYLVSRICNDVMAHVGAKAFDEVTGEKVNTTLLIFRREERNDVRENHIGMYFRLVQEPTATAKRERFEQALNELRKNRSSPVVYRYRQADFAAIPSSPWVYWITPTLRNLFVTLPKLSDIAQPRQGLATADNFRFLRFWWEVGTENIAFNCDSAQTAQATGKRWFPYMKGGSFRRWYGNQEYVVNWENDGYEVRNLMGDNGRIASRPQNTEYYFRRGVTWTDLTSGRFSARLSPGGFIFDVKGSSAFIENVNFALGVLNSSIAHYLLTLLNPTVSFQVGDLARLPIPEHSSPELEQLVNQAIELAKTDSQEDETTYDFIAPPDWYGGIALLQQRQAQLAQIEQKIDEAVYQLYGISASDRQAIETELGTNTSIPEEPEEPEESTNDEDSSDPLTPSELAHKWISYAFGMAIGRFPHSNLQPYISTDGILTIDRATNSVISILENLLDETAAQQIITTALGNGSPIELLSKYLAKPFFDRHWKQYRKRPIYWYLHSKKKTFNIWLFAHKYNRDTLFQVITNYAEPFMRSQDNELEKLRNQKQPNLSRRDARAIETQIEKQEQIISEVQDFINTVRRIANYNLTPDLNDGIALTIAPLYEVVPFQDAKKYWKELLEGKYTWSSISQQMHRQGLIS